MPSKDYPDNIYGKTIILWACFAVVGQMTCICCILGPLFWLDIMKRTDGQPGSFGGIHMTVIGLILLPITIMFAFQLFARQWPMIKIHQEGLQIREIGKPMQIQSLGPLLFIPGFNLVLIILVSFWQLITLQMFHVKTTRLRWEEITNIVQGTGSLEIAGWPNRDSKEILDANPHAVFCQFCYNQDSFGLPTERVGEIVQHYRLSLNARQLLRSWDDDFSSPQHFE